VLFRAWVEENGIDVPDTAWASTGREGGGSHLLFDARAVTVSSWPVQGAVKAHGFDVKSNGFISVEPSFHPNGTPYLWYAYDVAPIGDFAKVLCELRGVDTGGADADYDGTLREWVDRYGRGNMCRIMSGLAHKTADAIVDSPHDAVFGRVSAVIRAVGEGHKGAYGALLIMEEAFADACERREHRARSGPAVKAEWESILAHCLRKHGTDDIVATDPCTKPRDDVPRGASSTELVRMEDEFWKSSLELATIRYWSHARRAAPMAVLGYVLARLICHIPPCVRLPGNGTLNMLIAIAAPPGAGKGKAAEVAGEAIRFTTPGVMKERPLGSGEGIPRLFGYQHYDAKTGMYELKRSNISVLIDIREIDTLTAIGGRAGSTLSPTLRQLYSGELLGFSYADIKKQVIIDPHTYRSCVVAGVQPGKGAVILNDTESGFAQRWLWLPVEDVNAPAYVPPVPEQIVWEPPEKIDSLDMSDDEVVIMEVCEKARNLIDTDRYEVLRGMKSDGLDGHRLYTQLKLAAALALLEGSMAVQEIDWDRAGFIMSVSDGVRDEVARTLKSNATSANRARGREEGIRAEAARETAEQIRATRSDRIARNVMKKMPARPEWVPFREIKNGIAARDRSYLPDVLSELAESGKLESTGVVGATGNKGAKYRRAK
jgi:hypothetical protein